MNVCQDTLVILMHHRMDSAKLVRVIQKERFNHPMESRFVTQCPVTAVAKQTSLAKTVMNAKMDFGILSAVRAVRAASVILLDHITPHATFTPDSATVNQE
jgi:glutamate synthase domain-containing protein 2